MTLSVGGETPTYNIFGESSGPVFARDYEFRIMKYLAAEAGFQSMLPLTTTSVFLPVTSVSPGVTLTPYPTGGYAFLTQSSRALINVVPFGPRFVLPLASDRFEVFAGGGGAILFRATGGYDLAAQTNIGGRVALDRGHRFWVGTSGRFIWNAGYSRQEWLSWTADLGIRF